MEENTEVKATNSMADVVAKIDNESKFKKRTNRSGYNLAGNGRRIANIVAFLEEGSCFEQG